MSDTKEEVDQAFRVGKTAGRVQAELEAAARIAALEAALQRLASPTQFCPGDPVAEVKVRCEYAEKARAALAPAPAPAIDDASLEMLHSRLRWAIRRLDPSWHKHVASWVPAEDLWPLAPAPAPTGAASPGD